MPLSLSFKQLISTSTTKGTMELKNNSKDPISPGWNISFESDYKWTEASGFVVDQEVIQVDGKTSYRITLSAPDWLHGSLSPGQVIKSDFEFDGQTKECTDASCDVSFEDIFNIVGFETMNSAEENTPNPQEQVGTKQESEVELLVDIYSSIIDHYQPSRIFIDYYLDWNADSGQDPDSTAPKALILRNKALAEINSKYEDLDIWVSMQIENSNTNPNSLDIKNALPYIKSTLESGGVIDGFNLIPRSTYGVDYRTTEDGTGAKLSDSHIALVEEAAGQLQTMMDSYASDPSTTTSDSTSNSSSASTSTQSSSPETVIDWSKFGVTISLISDALEMDTYTVAQGDGHSLFVDDAAAISQWAASKGVGMLSLDSFIKDAYALSHYKDGIIPKNSELAISPSGTGNFIKTLSQFDNGDSEGWNGVFAPYTSAVADYEYSNLAAGDLNNEFLELQEHTGPQNCSFNIKSNGAMFNSPDFAKDSITIDQAADQLGWSPKANKKFIFSAFGLSPFQSDTGDIVKIATQYDYNSTDLYNIAYGIDFSTPATCYSDLKKAGVDYALAFKEMSTISMSTDPSANPYPIEARITFADYLLKNGSTTVVDNTVDSSIHVDLGSHSSTTTNVNLRGNLSAHVVGNQSENEINGNQGSNLINAKQGSDTVKAAGGNDYVDGATGNDSIHGGSGNDTLLGGHGENSDTLKGGSGRDSLSGGAGGDSIHGGQGTDTISGEAGHDSVQGSGGDDSIQGGAGNDSVHGGTGNDSVQGDSGDDAVKGSGGNDSVQGGAGNDSVQGGTGNDSLKGGGGNDVIKGGSGDDTITGGNGKDTFVVGKGNDTITDYNRNEDIIKTDSDNSLSQSGNNVIIDHGNGSTTTVVNNTVKDVSISPATSPNANNNLQTDFNSSSRLINPVDLILNSNAFYS